MSKHSDALNSLDEGGTAVITHRVPHQHQREYDDWLVEIGAVCRAFPGHLDLQIIRPVAGLTSTYTIVIRFDTRAHLAHWMNSSERSQLIERVRPLLADGDDFFIRSGLDFWFTPEGARAKLPTRWKQFVITWSAIYPLVLGTPFVLLPPLRSLGIPQYHYLDTVVVTGVVVGLMVYVVMPRYTRLVERWLFSR